MSDRIKDLARQAGLIAPYGSDREGLANFDYRKFAKLIIKECIIVGHKAWINDHSTVPWFPKAQIKEHFGIKDD